jgi:hypothetical protein
MDSCNTSEERATYVSVQACLAAAVSQKSMDEAERDGKAATTPSAVGVHKRPSSTRFSFPGRYWVSLVNSEMNASCLCCLVDQGSETLSMAKDSGF